PLPLRDALIAGARHRARMLRCFLHEGIERARSLDRADMRVGQLEGGDVFVVQALARLRERERGEVRHSGLSQTKLFLGSVVFGASCRIRIVPSGCSSRTSSPGCGRPMARRSSAVCPTGICPVEMMSTSAQMRSRSDSWHAQHMSYSPLVAILRDARYAGSSG